MSRFHATRRFGPRSAGLSALALLAGLSGSAQAAELVHLHSGTALKSDGEEDSTSPEAELPESEAPDAVRWTINGGLGPDVWFRGPVTTGRLAFDGQYRIFGSDAGPAVGPMLHFNFRQRTFGLQLGAIFMWEMFLADPKDIRIYVGPLAATGYGMMSSRFGGVTAVRNYWFLTLGGQARAMFNEKFGAFVRPINFDITAGNGGAMGAWSFIAGVSLDF
ncbi:MAG: hypothetical protein ACPHRO_03020 [Nannocystaceae bacterium]